MADFSIPTSHIDGVDDGDNNNTTLKEQHGNNSENNDGDLFNKAHNEQVDLFGSDKVSLKFNNNNNCDDNNSSFVDTIKPTTSSINEAIVGIVKSGMTPPPRPPPPTNSTPRSISPIIGDNNNTTVTNKSAFDDLNDSIRMALGGSPSRPSPSVQQQQQQQQQQSSVVIGSGNVGLPVGVGQKIITNLPGYVVPPNQVILGYGSPIKQSIAGDGNY